MGDKENIDSDGLNTFAKSYLDTKSYFDAEPKILSMDDVLKITKGSDVQAISDNICVVKNRNNPSYKDVIDKPNNDIMATIDCGHGHDYSSKLLVDAGATPWYHIPYEYTGEAVTAKKEPIEDKFHVISDKKVKLFYNK